MRVVGFRAGFGILGDFLTADREEFRTILQVARPQTRGFSGTLRDKNAGFTVSRDGISSLEKWSGKCGKWPEISGAARSLLGWP